MVREYTTTDLASIKYFYEEKDDITRYVCWEDIKESIYRDFPHLEKALNDAVSSKKILDIVVESLD